MNKVKRCNHCKKILASWNNSGFCTNCRSLWDVKQKIYPARYLHKLRRLSCIAYYKKNKKNIIAKSKEYYKKNRDRYLEKSKQRYIKLKNKKQNG